MAAALEVSGPLAAAERRERPPAAQATPAPVRDSVAGTALLTCGGVGGLAQLRS